MTEETQTPLEVRLRDLSAKFNLPNKAYALLSCAAQKGLLPEVEEQLAILQEKAGSRDYKQPANKKVVQPIYSVQLLADYLEHGRKLYHIPLEEIICGRNSTWRTTAGGRNGLVARHPSPDVYSQYQDGEKDQY